MELTLSLPSITSDTFLALGFPSAPYFVWLLCFVSILSGHSLGFPRALLCWVLSGNELYNFIWCLWMAPSLCLISGQSSIPISLVTRLAQPPTVTQGETSWVNSDRHQFKSLKAVQIFLFFVYHMSPEGKFWSSLAHPLILGMCSLPGFPGSFPARSSGVCVLGKPWQAFAFCSDDTESSSRLEVQTEC